MDIEKFVSYLKGALEAEELSLSYDNEIKSHFEKIKNKDKGVSLFNLTNDNLNYAVTDKNILDILKNIKLSVFTKSHGIYFLSLISASRSIDQSKLRGETFPIVIRLGSLPSPEDLTSHLLNACIDLIENPSEENYSKYLDS